MLLSTIIQGIEQHFLVEELRTTAVEFAILKSEGKFPFGELTVLHYQMFGGTSAAIYEAAAAIELMILALDIFDDLQDQDQPSVPWSKLDPAISMNVAIGLLMLGGQLLAESAFEDQRKAKALQYFNSQAVKAVNGQHTDLLDPIADEEEYMDMVKQKSGALLACACVVGTSLATDDHHDTVLQYSTRLGMAAQIDNDMRDICRWDDKGDLLRKKKTLPSLYLLSNEQAELEIIRQYYSGWIDSDHLIGRRNEIEQLIRDSGALEYAAVQMTLHQMQARQQIEALPIEQHWKKKLISLM